MADRVTVRFPGTSFAPVSLERGARLSKVLTALNSPVLFGCRTGICGTCVVHVSGAIPPPGDDERETLEATAGGDPLARLACQVDLQADLEIRVP